jgi:hypothetical protein
MESYEVYGMLKDQFKATGWRVTNDVISQVWLMKSGCILNLINENQGSTECQVFPPQPFDAKDIDPITRYVGAKAVTPLAVFRLVPSATICKLSEITAARDEFGRPGLEKQLLEAPIRECAAEIEKRTFAVINRKP